MLTTRARILDTARRLFAERGFQNTSVREIAERLGLTKTAVLYHFPAKTDILAALADPYLEDLEAVLDSPKSPDGVIEALLDVHLKHRHMMRSNLMTDVSLQTSIALRYARIMIRANRLIAGDDPDFDERIRAAQTVAMLSDPVIAYADEPPEKLRAAVLRGVRALRENT
ncbi:helix-turn-helix domain-containing protein [Amycolatopsis minnesotensis]|uniref:HTH tetR-type domain-containing protein n=1 Tax=Amycolatopsis minnesotensis TaxID=337894 RepID=A0ABN2SQ05_9PSEU